MDAPDTALRGQNTTADGRLYMAFELGEKSWKLSLGDGQRAPSRCTVAAGDTTAVLTAIANARARCHLGADAPVYSCYEAGRDGFWLHRWLTEQCIVNLVVDSASIEVNRRARRAKTDRLDSDKLLSDELLNQDVKTNALGKSRPTSKADMIGTFRRHLHRQQKKPHVIRNPFKERHVSYAA
ncbi:hypothetical protein [Burkholderia ubonensis]|uniref:hypothetical protein n=1 Tax=Burkholderia ubonensis TaxID=101571 RepID=UPI000AFB1419